MTDPAGSTAGVGPSGPRRAPAEMARAYLAQRAGLEGEVLILEERTRAEALELVRGRRVPPAPGPTPPATSGAAAAAVAAGPETVAPPVVATGGGGAEDPTEAGAPAVTDATIEAAPSLEALSELVAACVRCPLHETRTNPVFGEGDPSARVVCVGEAPGANEDRTGRPFVGRAGQLLDRLLLTIGLPRESVYICNVLKSRPPGNRDPLPDEVSACSPYLLRQLSLIQPEVILAFGAFAARTLLSSSGALGRMRGRVHEYAGYPVVVTYHPAALLRNPGWTRPTWEDLQIVRGILDGEAA